jgi:hypothetical protein
MRAVGGMGNSLASATRQCGRLICFADIRSRARCGSESCFPRGSSRPASRGSGAANCSDNGDGIVCGMSNLFLPSRNGEIHRLGAIAVARATLPGMFLIGYLRGDDLEAMRTLGFRVLGQLRVWIRESVERDRVNRP